jgi:hypothetical protein
MGAPALGGFPALAGTSSGPISTPSTSKHTHITTSACPAGTSPQHVQRALHVLAGPARPLSTGPCTCRTWRENAYMVGSHAFHGRVAGGWLGMQVASVSSWLRNRGSDKPYRVMQMGAKLLPHETTHAAWFDTSCAGIWKRNCECHCWPLLEEWWEVPAGREIRARRRWGSQHQAGADGDSAEA